jgi:hypothetical protein
MKLNGTHKLLVHADNIKLLEDNTNTIKKNAVALMDTSKKAGLKVKKKITK